MLNGRGGRRRREEGREEWAGVGGGLNRTRESTEWAMISGHCMQESVGSGKDGRGSKSSQDGAPPSLRSLLLSQLLFSQGVEHPLSLLWAHLPRQKLVPAHVLTPGAVLIHATAAVLPLPWMKGGH